MILVVAVATFAQLVVVLPARCVEHDGLGFAISTEKDVYALGEPIRVTFTWTNLSGGKLVIPRWRGPTGGVTVIGHADNDIYDFSVYYDGTEKLAYHGEYACGPTQSLTLEPGAILTRGYEINDAYEFRRPGRYVLRTAYFGYGPDDTSPEHWRGRIVHPDVEVWVRE